LFRATVTSVATEALADAAITVTDTAVRALVHIVVSRGGGWEELVHMESRVDSIGVVSVVVNGHTPVGGDITGDHVGAEGHDIVLLLIQKRSTERSICPTILSGVRRTLSEDTLSGVQIDVRRILLWVGEGQESEHVGLVQAVEDVVELVAVVGIALTGDVTIVQRSRGVVETVQGVVQVIRHVGSVNITRRETESSLRELRSQRQGTLSGVHIIVVSGKFIWRIERVQQAEDISITSVVQLVGIGSCIVDSGIVTSISISGHSADQLDNVRVVLASIVPVIHIDVVSSVEISITETRLQQGLLLGSKSSQERIPETADLPMVTVTPAQ